MAKPVIKFFDKIIVILLGFLGIFSGCIQPKYGMPAEYGTPYGKYEVKGIVTDKETSNPIPNIQVIKNYDTIHTNAEGKYSFYEDYSYEYETTFHLKVEDIDGEENGGYFAPQEMDLTFTKEDQVEKGDGHWYKGKFVKTQNIELERMEAPEYGVRQTVFKP